MRKLNIFERIIIWLKSINEKKAKENSDKIKRKLCLEAVHSGVCPHFCDVCAWNTYQTESEG